LGKKNKMRRDELTIQELEQQKRLLRAKKELEELQKPAALAAEPNKENDSGSVGETEKA
jgi:hypothetical protein